MEDRLAGLGEKLAAAEQEADELRDRLREEIARREDWLAVVSHELRTPLTVVSGYQRLLLTEQVGPLNEEQRTYLEQCASGCRQLNEVLGQMLEPAWTRFATRDIHGEVLRSSLELGDERLEDVLGAVLRFLSPRLEEADCRVELDIDSEAQWARFDRRRVEQVLINLLENALRHGGPEIRIEVALAAASKGSAVQVSVWDSGSRGAAEDRGALLGSARASCAETQSGGRGRQRQGGGLGLGLAICRRILEAHGGELSFARGERGGSRFEFTLPAAEAQKGTCAGGQGKGAK